MFTIIRVIMEFILNKIGDIIFFFEKRKRDEKKELSTLGTVLIAIVVFLIISNFWFLQFLFLKVIDFLFD